MLNMNLNGTGDCVVFVVQSTNDNASIDRKRLALICRGAIRVGQSCISKAFQNEDHEMPRIPIFIGIRPQRSRVRRE